ncbi:MAG: hypothetical protein ACOY94_29230 [Bacillota bacterium]
MASREPHPGPVVWDTEERRDLASREGRIRDDIMYLTSALLFWMEQTWGGVVTHLKTSTIVERGEVLVGRALPGEPGATPLRRTGSLNTGEVSFWRPLYKLGLRVPPDRQFHVTPFLREVEGEGTLFVFPMNERVSAPRHGRRGAKAAEAAQA